MTQRRLFVNNRFNRVNYILNRMLDFFHKSRDIDSKSVGNFFNEPDLGL